MFILKVIQNVDAYVLNANLFNRECRFSVLVRDLWYM